MPPASMYLMEAGVMTFVVYYTKTTTKSSHRPKIPVFLKAVIQGVSSLTVG